MQCEKLGLLPLRWIAALILFLQPQLVGAADRLLGCHQLALEPAPVWSISAAWSADGRELALVDILGAKIIRYSESGAYLGSVSRPGQGALEFNDPIRLIEAPDGFLLEAYPGKAIWLDRSYRPQKAVDFLKVRAKASISGAIEGFGMQNIALAGEDLIGFVILHRNGVPWKGFARLTVRPFQLTELLEEVKHLSPEDRIYNLTAGGEVAVTSGKTYVLRYTQPIHILQLTPTRRSLKTFPAEFTTVAKLPETPGGPASGVLLFKALERMTLPVALYGRGDFLYLLTRKPAAQGTLWQIWQIDPKRDLVVRSLTLPTTANHVFLAPGPKDWAVIEKGPVTQPAQQAIKSMLLIPSPWIEDPASKALTDGNTVTCH